MTSPNSKDNVLTLLIHLGYLTYDGIEGTVRIPNKEVAKEYLNAIEDTDGLSSVAKTMEESNGNVCLRRHHQ